MCPGAGHGAWSLAPGQHPWTMDDLVRGVPVRPAKRRLRRSGAPAVWRLPVPGSVDSDGRVTGRRRGEEPARSAYLRELRRGRRRRGTGAPDADADGRRRSQWPVLAVAVLPGLAALVALLFTWREVRVAEQGQLTARFNDAITNLGSESLDVRFGGIYALERIMQDSPRDQPRIVLVLSAYVRRHASVPATGFVKEPTEPQPGRAAPADRRPPTDVMAVVNVLARRSPGHDGDTQIDWNRADLRGLSLSTWSFKDIAKVPEGGALPDE